jgi:hypothetical protein
LTTFNTKTGEELVGHSCYELKFDKPINYFFNSLEEVKAFIKHQEESDVTFEGVVIKDCNGLRLKIKSLAYVNLHQLKGNGNIANTKNILPFVLSYETDEVIAYFPELKPRVDEVKAMVDELYSELLEAWRKCRFIEDQKEFALAIKDCRMNGLLFNLKKRNTLSQTDVHDLFRESSELILKLLKEN